MKYFYAHTLLNRAPEHWEHMHEHESRVADRCARFLGRIQPSLHAWGILLGNWHDIGKYSDEFQKYISVANNVKRVDLHRVDVNGKVDHSTAAAQLSEKKFGKLGLLLAYPFAGHHAGLPDWDVGKLSSGLRQRLEKNICCFEKNAPEDLLRNAFQGML